MQTVEALSDAIAEHPPASDHERIVEEMTILIVNYLSKPAATVPVSRAPRFSLGTEARAPLDVQWADLEP